MTTIAQLKTNTVPSASLQIHRCQRCGGRAYVNIEFGCPVVNCERCDEFMCGHDVCDDFTGFPEPECWTALQVIGRWNRKHQ